jgi:type VI secretion system protein ImpE
MPVIYDPGQPDLADEFLLGRATDWIGPEEGLVRGVGQREFLIGNDAVGIMELSTLRFGP